MYLETTISKVFTRLVGTPTVINFTVGGKSLPQEKGQYERGRTVGRDLVRGKEGVRLKGREGS